MKKKSELIRVFTGTKLVVLALKSELEDLGVNAMIRDDYQLGIDAGFVGGVQSSVDLFILESDMEKARPLLIEFTDRNK